MFRRGFGKIVKKSRNIVTIKERRVVEDNERE